MNSLPMNSKEDLTVILEVDGFGESDKIFGTNSSTATVVDNFKRY